MPEENSQIVSPQPEPTQAEKMFPAETEKKAGETSPEAKPPEPKPEAPPALTAADIKFPEGVEVQQELFSEFLGVMNNRTLTPAQQAQSLIDLQAKVMTEASEKGSEAAAKMNEDWVAEVKAHPDYNTEDKLNKSLARVSKSIDLFGTPRVREVLTLTGAGNNLEILRFIDKLAVAAKVEEGTPIIGSVSSPPRSAAEILYPNQGKI